MVNVKIPYGKGFENLKLEENRVRGILKSRADEYQTNKTQDEIVKYALENPIGAPKLRDLAMEAKRVLVITSDHTRPVPSKITLPIILQEIRSLNPDIDIKIVIATGFHRATSYEEIVDKFGSEIADNESIVNHDSRDIENMVFKGILPSGGELWLNSLVDWSDLIVAEGFIEPHFFAGFSGGRKSILPGIAAEKTVFANHCSKFIASHNSTTGKIEENPIHKDMIFAAETVKLKFILNVVINSEKEIINAFAGHYNKAHLKGCEFVRDLFEVQAVEADIVITSNGGYPLDQNIYQAVKGMTAAEACVREGGIIIIAAACNDGHGGEEFYKWFADASSPEKVADKISCISQEDTIADQWQSQILARILMKAKVIIVSEECNRRTISDMHMIYASSLERALEIAEKEVGNKADITIIPDGVGVIIKTV